VQKAPEAAQGRLLHGLESLSKQQVLRIYSSSEKVVRLMEIEDVKAPFFFSEEWHRLHVIFNLNLMKASHHESG
jgi:hypothetical protein